MTSPFSYFVACLIFGLLQLASSSQESSIRGEKSREGPQAAAEAAAAQTSSSILGKDLAESRGMVLLDAITYDIVLDHLEGCDIMVGFFSKRDLRKGSSSPEHSSRKAYLDFVVEAHSQTDVDLSNMIFAQVIVNGGENKMLAERNEINTFPSYIFISRTNKTSIIHMPYRLEDHRPSAFMSFLGYFGHYDLLPPGLIREFDALARQFIAAEENEEQSVILNAAKDLLEKHEDTATLPDAEFYVKVMADLIDQRAGQEGEGAGEYILHEGYQRLGRARDEELSAYVRATAERELNILRSFRAVRKTIKAAANPEL